MDTPMQENGNDDVEDDDHVVAHVSCLFCDDLVAENVKTMPEHKLRYHMAVNHIDLHPSPAHNFLYTCDGDGNSGEDGSCSPESKFETPVVNEFIDHMETEHPDTALPFHTSYKAAVSDLMAELCSFRSAQSLSAPSDNDDRLWSELEILLTSTQPPVPATDVT